MAHRFFLQLTFIAVICSALDKGRRKSDIPVLKFEDFRECPNPGVDRLRNITMEIVGRGKYVINLIYDVAKPIADGKIWVTIQKCRSSSASECEHFMKVNVDICPKFEEKGQPWTTFLKSVKPELKCPVKPGFYIVRNGTFDATELIKLSATANKWILDYYWRSKFTIVGKKEILTCGMMVISFQKLRV